MNEWQNTLTIVTLIGAPVLGIFLAIKAYGGKNGERYQKQRMQGPFVPLGGDDTADNAAQIRERKSRNEPR